ncbi:MAG: hypothetical protein R8N23_17445 [Reichenbachiella sp.]|uniref:hypothetical protein n=1 Tax=Reichenbachiella sp. TaxID=2184521 RepID=UPI002966083C|nr:hypothetical protein [Reichenbachiella sp.]MDW3211657.1 hypothetical protein [Reichenbachiella sp.]
MSLQYITDDKGQTTGVYIPIQEWDNLKAKYEGIEEDAYIVPEWQKEIVRERIKNTKPEEYLSWEDVEKQLKLD